MALLIRKKVSKQALLGVWKIEEDENWYFSNPLVTDRVQKRIDAYKSVQRKLQGIAVRVLIKSMLPDEINVDIDYDDRSKPFFTEADYNLSITHSDTMVAVLVSREVLVGVDIEKYSSKVERVGHKFVNETEQNVYNSVPPNKKMDYLHVLWGAKESMYKLYGKGSMDFKKHILVDDFQLSSAGDFTGVVGKDERFVKVTGYYTKLDKFVLVYVLEKTE